TASTLTIRDAYMDFKPWSAFKIMAGQYKVPFSMEVGTGDTAVEFYNRSIIQVLYPDAGGGFRAPGVDVHGDLGHGRAEYWAGLFNGQGLLTSGTTNEPEVVGRLRFTPWKNSSSNGPKGLSFGGSIEHSRSKGLANELSFSGVLSDGTYTFFPQFRINGGVERYNGFFSWLRGPLGIRGEYAHLLQKRTNIGSLAPSGDGFADRRARTGERHSARKAPGHWSQFSWRIWSPGLGCMGSEGALFLVGGESEWHNLQCHHHPGLPDYPGNRPDVERSHRSAHGGLQLVSQLLGSCEIGL